MDLISGVEKNRSRYDVYIEGRRTFRVPETLFKQNPLREGEEIDLEAYRNWLSGQQFEWAWNYALDRLTVRQQTSEEIRRRLFQLNIESEAVDAVIERLRESNLLDDEAYARDFVEQHRGTKSSREIMQKLYLRGVAREDLEGIIDDIDIQPEEELAAAIKAARGLTRRYDDQRKLIMALARRGFSFDTAREAVQALEDS